MYDYMYRNSVSHDTLKSQYIYTHLSQMYENY